MNHSYEDDKLFDDQLPLWPNVKDFRQDQLWSTKSEVQRCRACNEIKPLSEFYVWNTKNGQNVRHFARQCKTCLKRISRERYHADPQTRLAAKKYRESRGTNQRTYERKARRYPINICKALMKKFIGRGRLELAINELAYTPQMLMESLQTKFLSGMTWNNYGPGKKDWQVDHIKPCRDFDLTDKEQRKTCHALDNLQPLWREANASKGPR